MHKEPQNINEEVYTNRELWLIINNNMEKLDNVVERFDKFEEKLDKILEGKANIWVEKFLIWAGIVIGGGLLTFLGSQIIKLMQL